MNKPTVVIDLDNVLARSPEGFVAFSNQRIAAAGSHIPALLYGSYPRNRVDELPGGVIRAKDWPAVLEYFDGIG